MAQKTILDDKERFPFYTIEQPRSEVISDLLLKGLNFETEEFHIDLVEVKKAVGQIEEKIKESVDIKATLTKRVEALEKEIKELAKELTTEIVEKVVVLKPITKKEARAKIIRLFKSGKVLYYTDIVQKLGIDLPLVVEICNELEKEGIIGTARK